MPKRLFFRRTIPFLSRRENELNRPFPSWCFLFSSPHVFFPPKASTTSHVVVRRIQPALLHTQITDSTGSRPPKLKIYFGGSRIYIKKWRGESCSCPSWKLCATGSGGVVTHRFPSISSFFVIPFSVFLSDGMHRYKGASNRRHRRRLVAIPENQPPLARG